MQKSQSIKVPLRRPNICLTEAIFPTTKAVTAQKNHPEYDQVRNEVFWGIWWASPYAK